MPRFEAADPNFRARVEEIFQKASFIAHLGIELTDVALGTCRSRMTIQPWQLQQDGVIHAGVMTTMADHTAGAAAGTLLAPDKVVLSVGLNVHILRPGQAAALRCEAHVLKPGRTLSFVEAGVYAETDSAGDRPLLTLTATMAYVPAPKELFLR
ncbi:MAG: PaaI family thioesterase [Myxococcota bacterium]